MTSGEFLTGRARELCEFFRGHYGTGWRAKVYRACGITPQTLGAWFNPRPLPLRATRSLIKAEQHAESLGWRPSLSYFLPPLERSRLKRFETVCHTVSCQVLGQCVYTRFSVKSALQEWPYHRKHDVNRISDVLSPTKYELSPKEPRIRNPIAHAGDRSPVLTSPVHALGALHPLDPPTPGVPPCPTGGEDPPPASLSASRAEIRVVRERLIRHILSPRAIIRKFPAKPWQREQIYRGAFKRVIRELDSDIELTRRQRDAVLSHCIRYVEGVLLKNDLKEKLTDSVYLDP